MSTVASIVRSVWEMDRNDALTPENVISMFMSERWTRHEDAELNYEDLTLDELAIVDMWLYLNAKDYKKTKMLIQDFVEVFTGVTMGAAGILVSDYIEKR